MSPVYDLSDIQMVSFPRVSGDEPFTSTIPTWSEMFSPRERG